jgi:hypothetical protein
MGGIRYLAVILLLSLFIFGCTTPQPPASGTGGSGSASGGSGASGGATGGGSSGGGASGGSTDGGASTGGQTGGNAVDDLTGKTYVELMGLGVPMQCDITTTSQGVTTQVKHYILNSNTFRSEMTTPEGDCLNTVVIFKDKDMYVGCPGKKYPTGTTCDWMKFTSEGTDQPTSGGSDSFEAPDYTNVPTSQISCVPWVPDNSKFAVNGKACTIQDITDEMMNQYSNN